MAEFLHRRLSRLSGLLLRCQDERPRSPKVALLAAAAGIAFAGAALPVAAQDAAPREAGPEVPELTLEQTMLLRCSAAFAIVAHRQNGGDSEALEFPPLQTRGSEFFVRSTARLIDETGIDRKAVVRVMSNEAQELRESGQLMMIMPACMEALGAAGL